MLKTTKSTESAAKLKKTKAGLGSNSIVDNGEVINQINSIKRKNQAKTTKSKILIKSKNHDFSLNSKNMEAKPDFLIPKARLAFTKLKQAFVEAPILYHFDPKYHIRILINVSGYVIGGILSQLTSNELSSWYPVIFFF